MAFKNVSVKRALGKQRQDGEPQSGLRTVPPALAGVLLEAQSLVT